MSECAEFCSRNPNPALCLRDCRGGLRAVPISKKEDAARKYAWGPLLLMAAVALGAGAAAWFMSRNVYSAAGAAVGGGLASRSK